MNLLHLNSEYTNKSLYKKLVEYLNKYDIKQFIVAPIKRKELQHKYSINNSNIKLYYPHILNKFDRVRYFNKIKKISHAIEKEINIGNIDIFHAHTLYTNGGPAYLLHKKYSVPYIVTIRNTDIHIFFKYFIHVRKFAKEILFNAKKIIVISPHYKHFIIEKFDKSLENKISIIPNGIDDFWHSNEPEVKEIKLPKIKILYVGEFSKNKNIENIINSTQLLINKGYDIGLTLVGNYGNNVKSISNIVSSNEFIKIENKVTDKDELREIYKNHDIFVMPSFRETFGLVYGEAMSTGMPVIYTMGQGIDGYFENGYIGYAVDPNSEEDIADKILNIATNYGEFTKNCLKSVELFRWDKIANTYIELYKQ